MNVSKLSKRIRRHASVEGKVLQVFVRPDRKEGNASVPHGGFQGGPFSLCALLVLLPQRCLTAVQPHHFRAGTRGPNRVGSGMRKLLFQPIIDADGSELMVPLQGAEGLQDALFRCPPVAHHIDQASGWGEASGDPERLKEGIF